MQTRTLADQTIRDDRLARLREPHIVSLAELSKLIHSETGCWTPNFDPESGGIRAKVLFLLESPGPKVSETGFISQDNPDKTAENMTQLLENAGLSRFDVVLWNIVPWQMSEKHVVTPKLQQLKQAAPYTLRLLNLLPDLSAVVLVGKRAQRGWEHVALPPERHIEVFNCPHPSPQNFNSRPTERQIATSQLQEVAKLIPK